MENLFAWCRWGLQNCLTLIQIEFLVENCYDWLRSTFTFDWLWCFTTIFRLIRRDLFVLRHEDLFICPNIPSNHKLDSSDNLESSKYEEFSKYLNWEKNYWKMFFSFDKFNTFCGFFKMFVCHEAFLDVPWGFDMFWTHAKIFEKNYWFILLINIWNIS